MAESGLSAAGHDRIANRYLILETLGRGGMATVFRATDTANGREVALKQLTAQPEQRATFAALFEHEFHVLAQLRHPRVISVYDYGVTPDGGAYYTMELLDGGDLRDRAPVPWRELCSYAFDVCSSLALVHSRRLLHRDVSPRNVRCGHDGKAKLIDFGAIAPMGTGAGIVGTPAFVAPETVSRSALDARTDLFSLGATMYYALTGHVPFAARSFADLFKAWTVRPIAPSARVPGIPHELDDLVLSLLQIEPSLRPQSAFDVMQRLAAIAGLDANEGQGVARAYLATPQLVARESVLTRLKHDLESAKLRRGSALMIRAPAGLGRSRVLDACALEAKTLGVTVLRATAGAGREPFSVALALFQHLVEAMPDVELSRRFPELFRPDGALKSPAELTGETRNRNKVFSRFMLAVSRRSPLLIAVDDVHRIDERSAALLADLADHVRRGRMSIVLTCMSDAPASVELDVLTRRCRELPLPLLTRDDTKQLLGSLFGDAPNLEMLTGEIFDIARGNPRHCMELAQHLVDGGSITYNAGTWTLPAQLSTDELPRSAEDAIRARVALLSKPARFVAAAHALAFNELFDHADYRRLCPELSPAQLEAARTELVSHQALVSDGVKYALSNRLWSAALSSSLEPGEAQSCHRALAAMFEPRSNIAWIHHLFEAGLEEQGLDAVIARQDANASGSQHNAALDDNIGGIAPQYFRCIELAERFRRGPREVADRRRWSVALSVASNGAYYEEASKPWLAQLVRDSGLEFWREDVANAANPGERLMRALTRAHERWVATPEAERVYSVEEALKLLAEFVAISIAVGSRSQNLSLIASLPPLLEPFAPLSPILHAIWQNAIATNQTVNQCQYERARDNWLAVHEQLGKPESAQLSHVEVIRNAVAYGIGMCEAVLGRPSALDWADYLDLDPYQKVSALYLRKIVRLEQGDWIGAERYGRQAELIALQSATPEMFTFMLMIELEAHAQARDLIGLKDVIARLQRVAARFAGWQDFLRCAEARFELIRGDYAAAREGFERCLATTQSRAVWIGANAGLAEVLLALGEAAEVQRRLAEVLEKCERWDIGLFAYDLRRLMALAEAKLGDYDAANRRLDAQIEQQRAAGVSGLKLGLSYEARAQVAVWSGDEAAFDAFAKLTAREYRHGARCPLGARYESLVNDARRRGFQPAVKLTDFDLTTMMSSTSADPEDIQSIVDAAMTQAQRIDDRSHKALELVCSASGSSSGYLYLTKADRVVLAATHLRAEPPAELEQLVQKHLSDDLHRSEMLTEMVTGVPEEVSSDETIQLAGTVYELLLLRCVVANVGRVTGVAAVAVDGAREADPHRPQLLAAVAAQLAL